MATHHHHLLLKHTVIPALFLRCPFALPLTITLTFVHALCAHLTHTTIHLIPVLHHTAPVLVLLILRLLVLTLRIRFVLVHTLRARRIIKITVGIASALPIALVALAVPM